MEGIYSNVVALQYNFEKSYLSIYLNVFILPITE